MSRKNVRRGWIASAAVVGVTAVSVPMFNAFAQESHASNNDDCEIEALSDDGGLMHAVSASGEYIAGTSDGEPTVWRDGEKIDLPLEELDDTAEVHGVNSSGAVVGSYAPNGSTQGWLYQDGQLTLLSAEGYGSHRVVDINDDGQMIGESWSTEDGMHAPDVVLRWEPGEQTARELPLRDDHGGQVHDLDEAGNIVGHQSDADEEDPDYLPWIWDAEGNDHEVSGGPEGQHSLISVDREFALSDAGEGETQYYWDLTADGPFEVDELRSASTIDVNGVLYGMLEVDQPGFVSDGEPTELPTLGGSDEHKVVDVSEDGGTIVGTSTDEDGNQRPVAWLCG